MSEGGNVIATVRNGAVAVAGRSEAVWVAGPDAVTFLDGLLSQNIAAMEVGSTARSLLLSPQGKLRATLLVLRGEERVGLVADTGRGEIVFGDLSRFKIRVDALIATPVPVWEVWGNASATGLTVPAAGAWAESGSVVTFRMPFRHSELDRVALIGATPDCPEVRADDLLPLRIEIGEPVMGVDLTEKTIPQEGADVAGSVDFAKGCYLGQELVARIDSRGHVNKRLAGLLVAGSAVPAAGSEVTVGGRPVGTVTSAAWSPERGTVVALAMIRMEVAHGVAVDVGPADGTVVDLPMTF